MKCVKCGAEMKEGCVYCSVCGNEAQIVPDYSVFEDDYLRSLLAEEHKTSEGKKAPAKSLASKPKKKKRNNKLPIMIVCLILLVAIIAGVIIKIYINDRNANSYDYQVDMAQKEAFSKNYEEAIAYYKNALAIQPKDIPVRMAMADIYIGQQEYDSAIVLLLEVIDIDAGWKEAYRELIAIYEEREDYDSILALTEGVADTAILELFEGYIVAPPVISPEGDTFDEYIDITIFSVEDYPIYYTLDGTTPDTVNGKLYDSGKGITIEEAGTYKLQAICYNEKGIGSEIVSETYELELLAPEYPTVTPDGGKVENGTLVTITAEEYCSIYYTWDNTDPTIESAKYEAPIEVPSGKSVLSVLVVDDRTGLDSGIYRTNFTRNP